MFVTLFVDDKDNDYVSIDEEDNICASTNIYYISSIDEGIDSTLPFICIYNEKEVSFCQPKNGDFDILHINIDEALIRLKHECEAIFKFRINIKTKEQQELTELLGLTYNGEKIVLIGSECFGIYYSKNSTLCNFNCDMKESCINEMKIMKKRIQKAFPTMYKTIFELIKKQNKSYTV